MTERAIADRLEALSAWHDKSEASAVVPLLSVPATSFQHSAVVTEHGTAEMLGRSDMDQARLLIDRAVDPRARGSLREAAGTLGLVVTPV